MRSTRIQRVFAPLTDPESSFFLTRRLFVASLAAVYAMAFASLFVQIEGLIGSEGITPAADWLERLQSSSGSEIYWKLPTLFWLGASDAGLRGLCASGVAIGALTSLGFVPRLGLFLLWGLYLSLAGVGGPFLGFQWDGLLLETGLIAILFAPPTRWRAKGRGDWKAPVSRPALWLLRWLLFRLMFLSGVVKLRSGDDAWWGLTALDYHYFTQPIPAWTAYYVHHLPHALHALSVFATFAIELGAPLLIFGNRRCRLWAAGAFVVLQLTIASTGNYGFFNLSSLALCLTLVDDRWLEWVLPDSWTARLRGSEGDMPSLPADFASRLASVCVIVLLALSLLRLDAGFLGWVSQTGPAQQVLGMVAPFRSSNSYGLFAVMTTTRPEIIIEGSNDGESWQAYEFHWKPGALDRRPRFIGPHMPRLDWQMWFAALGSCQREIWLQNFLVRLLEGSPSVLDLLAFDPFPEAPPRYLRSTLYSYEFSPIGSGSSDWWIRKRLGSFCPTLALVDGQLHSVQLERD